MSPCIEPPASLEQCALRLGCALVAGLILGYERERHGRPAGLRTTTLVSISSALAMIISEYLFLASSAPSAAWRPDPARLAAGILTGIGFLGAGTIIRHDNIVRGVTTAATLWFVTVASLAFGAGCFAAGWLAFAIALLVLAILPLFERHIQQDWYGRLSVTLDIDAIPDGEITRKIEACGASLRHLALTYDFETKTKTVRGEVRARKTQISSVAEKVVKEMGCLKGVRRVTWS